MTGLIPCLSASFVSSTAPARDPWSVSATAGIWNSAARAASSGIRQAPSRIEYSEWTWRWTKGAWGSGTGRQSDPRLRPPSLGTHKPARRSVERAMKEYRLIGPDGNEFFSPTAGTLGGHRKNKLYGRLDCPSALRWLAKGHIVQDPAFFA